MGIFRRRRSHPTPEASPQASYRPLDAAPPLKGSPQAPTAQGAACRICLSDEGELITPCACRGDSAHVHVACLARGSTERAQRARQATWTWAESPRHAQGVINSPSSERQMRQAAPGVVGTWGLPFGGGAASSCL